jgi:hypothetical protein
MTGRIILLALALLVLVFLFTKNRGGSATGGGWNVYGKMDCGWTRKQLDHMKNNGVKHTFVDCSSENCPNVDAFPTMIHSQSGETVVGYKEV